MSSTEVEHRVNHVRQRIVLACERSGRKPSEVVLIAVSKRQPLDRLRKAIACGLRTFGENHVQEAVAKSADLDVDLDWHLIGVLQSNKVKPAVRLFNTIHTLDRMKVAHRLAAEAERQDRSIEVFIQVHLGSEPTKHGFAEHGLAAAVRPLAELPRLKVVGLMAIPPFEEDLEEARKWFRRLRELRDGLAERPEWSDFPGYLSMGMSHDFEIAIEEGATHIRVGSDLFGPRPTP